MDIETILVPVDFSACTVGVVRNAASLGARLDARVHLLHVGELPSGMKRDTQIDTEGQSETAEQLLTRDAMARLEPMAQIARSAGVEVDLSETFGAIAPAILEHAGRIDADLIMMGTHGRVGLARLVLGSIAEAVVQGSMVPVMLIRRQPHLECGKQNCNWCAEGGRSSAERKIDAESVG